MTGSEKDNNLPPISVVIIGINVERYLGDCINSVLHGDYPERLLEIIYVDGGSYDRSVETARGFNDVRVIELKDPHPTPGKGRNAGIAAAGHEIIQFLDADTVLNPSWLRTAGPFLLKEGVAAVAGQIREKFPHKNLFHTIADMEWGISAGKDGHVFAEGHTKTFGGIVLIRKEAVIAAGCYDTKLVAGEDPDLSYRVRKQGWTIYRIPVNMVMHDINMSTFAQYLKRASRSGHAYAEIGLRYCREQEKYFLQQLLRICLGTLVPAGIVLAGMVLRRALAFMIAAAALIFRPLRKVRDFMAGSRSFFIALVYCVHLSLVVFPQFTGVLRYLYGRMTGRALQNKGYQGQTEHRDNACSVSRRTA